MSKDFVVWEGEAKIPEGWYKHWDGRKAVHLGGR